MKANLDDLYLPNCPSVLVIAPHPDDEVFGCGGLLSLLSSRGADINVDIITDGGFGAFGKDKFARKEESLRAAQILGYSPPNFWDLPDNHLRLDESLIERLRQRIIDAKPQLMLVPSIWERHPDHLVLAHASTEALRRSAHKTMLLFYEVGNPLTANLIIDISGVHQKKLEAMRCFQSQLEVQRFDKHIDALNSYRTYTLGREAIAAEAYFQAPADLIDFSGINLISLLQNNQQIVLSPKVSILIRSSGRPELQAALASALSQTYQNLEIIVINVSDVNSIVIAQNTGVVPVRVIERGVKLGRSKAANFLLAECTGEFALFLDDDDWLLPGHITSLVAASEKFPEAVASYCDSICVEQQDGEWKEIRRFSGPIESQRLAFENRFPIHSVLFRVKAVKGLEFDQIFDLYEDWDWWLQIATRGEMIYTSSVGAIYRIHPSGGEGVRADGRRSLAALKQIALKWHHNVALDILVERIAYVRQVIYALADEQQRSTDLVIKLDKIKLSEARLCAQHDERIHYFENELRLKNEQIDSGLEINKLLKYQLDFVKSNEVISQLEIERLTQLVAENANKSEYGNNSLEECRSELDDTRKMLAEVRQNIASIHKSKSWQLTRPFRGLVRFVRRLLGIEPRVEIASSTKNFMGRFKQLLLSKARSSSMARWLYYRLPIPESHKFKLRTWGRDIYWENPIETQFQASDSSIGQIESSGCFLTIPSNRFSYLNLSANGLPKVSVIIPCFNQGQFLLDSIGSAYSAYSGPLEVIVINDGSTDPLTLRCIRDIFGLYPDVRIINQLNTGLSGARNSGIDASTGEYLQFLDADDLLVPGKIDAQVQHLLGENIDISICNYLITDSSLKKHAKIDETISKHKSFELVDFLYKWERSLSVPIHCGLFSKNAFAKIRFNQDLHAKEDWLFWCCLTKAGFIPRYIDFHGAVYRMHDGSMRRSFVRMARQWMQAVVILDRMVAEDHPDFFEHSVRWVNQYYRSNPIYQDEIKAIARLE